MTREEAINIVRNICQTDKEKEALATLIPELAESEDERIRKELIQYLKDYPHLPNGQYTRPDFFAYLEKQKENIEKEYVFRPLAGTDINDAALQATIRAYEGDHLVLAFNGAYIPVWRHSSAKDIVDEYNSYLEKQKEQKTDAKSERVIKVAKRVLNNWLDGTDCPDVSGDFAELEYAIREYDGEEKQKEQQPAEKSEKPIIPEWSEEDDAAHTRILGAVAKAFMGVLPTKPSEEDVNWLKTLPERFGLQPKQEWSKEDDALLKEIVSFFKDGTVKLQHDLDLYAGFLENKFKSLSPQPHWKQSLSMADLENDLCDIQDNYPDGSHEYKVLGEAIEFIRSTESHWKPSEEQMKNLKSWVDYAGGDEDLESLYNDLKGLM